MSRCIGSTRIIFCKKLEMEQNEALSTFWSKMLTNILCYATRRSGFHWDWVIESDSLVNHQEMKEKRKDTMYDLYSYMSQRRRDIIRCVGINTV